MARSICIEICFHLCVWMLYTFFERSCMLLECSMHGFVFLSMSAWSLSELEASYVRCNKMYTTCQHQAPQTRMIKCQWPVVRRNEGAYVWTKQHVPAGNGILQASSCFLHAGTALMSNFLISNPWCLNYNYLR